ncbi:hypothetical protein KIS4809_0539 [Bacillus sp. ZZV12-4809]|nr:hypothetical protein KIS4809_0539 [Bacillus sp. ZZV12-4809]
MAFKTCSFEEAHGLLNSMERKSADNTGKTPIKKTTLFLVMSVAEV